eukprot:Em0002g991a
MPSRNQKKRSKQRAEYLQKREDILSQENKAKARERYKADPEKKKASVHGCLLSLKSWKLGPTPRNFEMSVSGLGNIQATDDLWNSLYNEVLKRNKHINALI